MKDEYFEARSKGGKASWAGVSKKDRSRRMSELGKLRWKKTIARKKSNGIR